MDTLAIRKLYHESFNWTDKIFTYILYNSTNEMYIYFERDVHIFSIRCTSNFKKMCIFISGL